MAFTYDPAGNRKTATDRYSPASGQAAAYQTNALNQYTQVSHTAGIPDTAPAYDDDGNQMNVNGWTVTYNAEDRPVLFVRDNYKVACQYDCMGRRTQKAVYLDDTLVSRKTFLYMGYLQIAELEDTGASPRLRATCHWDPTEPAATRPLMMTLRRNNTLENYYYHHGYNKNIIQITNQEGICVADYAYDPYGNLLPVSRGIFLKDNPFLFSSEYYDQELNLYYYNFRHYNPVDGRWINRDPIGEEGGINLYGFINNNLVNQIDILGRQGYGIGGPGMHMYSQGFGNSSQNSRAFDKSKWEALSPAGFAFEWIKDGVNESGFFKDIAGNPKGKGRKNPNVGLGTTGQELLEHLKKLSNQKPDCCIKTYTIAGHGRGRTDRASLASPGNTGAAGENERGIFAPSDPWFEGRGKEAISTDDIKKAIQNGSVKFCSPCTIQIYACRVHRLAEPLAKATGCTVIAAGGACSSIKGNPRNGWQTDGTDEIAKNFWKSEGGKQITALGNKYYPTY